MDFLNDDELHSCKAEEILNRMLSTRSYLPRSSALAEEKSRLRDEALRSYIQIGKGQCGTIVVLKGTDMVIKLANNHGKEDELFQDASMHKAIQEAFQCVRRSLRMDINIPRFHSFLNLKAQPLLDIQGSHLDNGAMLSDFGLVSERIYPLPLPVRGAIVDALCPRAIKAQKEEFLHQSDNKDCLLRLYLGRRGVDRSKIDPRNIRLRNFPIHVDEMEYLNLDTELYADVMAKSLATMHWKAGMDANDVEFVLGSAPQVIDESTVQDLEDGAKDTVGHLFHVDIMRRSVRMWLLDFNQCQKFTNDASGLKRLVDGFWWNDPYYPRPTSNHPKDVQLWKVFAQRYLAVSAEFTNSEMPKEFISSVEQRGYERSPGSLFQ